MRSEQHAELVWGHADGLQDAAHRACEKVFAAVDWHDGGTPVGWRIMWWLPLTRVTMKLAR
jgi:hypothetical protein